MYLVPQTVGEAPGLVVGADTIAVVELLIVQPRIAQLGENMLQSIELLLWHAMFRPGEAECPAPGEALADGADVVERDKPGHVRAIPPKRSVALG